MYRWWSCHRRSYVLEKISAALYFTPEGQPVFVTWRLAGSIPVPPAKLLKNDPNPGKSFADFDRKLDRSQLGPRWLGDTRVANMFVAALRYGETTRRAYDLAAWVVSQTTSTWSSNRADLCRKSSAG